MKSNMASSPGGEPVMSAGGAERPKEQLVDGLMELLLRKDTAGVSCKSAENRLPCQGLNV